MGKLLEDLVKKRLNEELEKNGGLHKNQFGFRKGRTTIQAMEEVQNFVGQNTRKRNNRGFCILVTIDVKNAFNTVRWDGIVRSLLKKGVNGRLVKLVQDYLQNRTIAVGTNGNISMTCGVPQGSKLGPLLWNVNYDDILEVKLPNGTSLIGFADDLALVVTGWTEEELQRKVECAIDITITALELKGLQIAPHKTEAVLLAGRHTLRTMSVQVQEEQITTKKSVQYLGVHFDKDMRMTEHARLTAEKADRITNQLVRIMPNLQGPRASKRRTVNSTVNSVILYAAPVWSKAMGMRKYVDALVRVQRRMALRVCSAYRTASTPAVQVVASMVPIDLLWEERIRIHKKDKSAVKDAKDETINKWQDRWTQTLDKAQWTKRIIPDLRQWVRRKHGEINYHLTQLLTGHGCFQAYLFRFKRSTNNKCTSCGRADTVEHTFFECPRWHAERLTLEMEVEGKWTPDELTGLLLTNKQNWDKIGSFVDKILNTKEDEERIRQNPND